MLHSLGLITGACIHATDGVMGTVRDFFFDDESWMLRYLVVQTGTWLARREVLIAITAVDHLDWEKREFAVQLNRDQVRHSPDVDTKKPVSRQQEIAMSRYFGWPTYWSVRVPAGRYTTETEYPTTAGDDRHLRSISAVTGYDVWASDGEIGKLEDFILDDGGWHVGYLVVRTGSWLASQNLLVSTRWVESISWANCRVDLVRSRDLL